jgi:hypothetical protein
MNRPTEAESLLLSGYAGMKSIETNLSTHAASHIPLALDILIEIYTALEKPAELERYKMLRSQYPGLKDSTEKDKSQEK